MGLLKIVLLDAIDDYLQKQALWSTQYGVCSGNINTHYLVTYRL